MLDDFKDSQRGKKMKKNRSCAEFIYDHFNCVAVTFLIILYIACFVLKGSLALWVRLCFICSFSLISLLLSLVLHVFG